VFVTEKRCVFLKWEYHILECHLHRFHLSRSTETVKLTDQVIEYGGFEILNFLTLLEPSLKILFLFWYRRPIAFLNESLYLLSQRTQILRALCVHFSSMTNKYVMF